MRKVMTLKQIREESNVEGKEKLGICALVDVDNMGFCKDDVTRWYTFRNSKGEECIYFKHAKLF